MKVEKMKKAICKSVWGDSKFDWACKDSEGRAGGILTIWNDEVFCKTSSWHSKEGWERRNGDKRDISAFDDFIIQSNLIELPLLDKLFTWYKADGSCKSKLDRMLVNGYWMKKWSDLVLTGICRSISDHCPILLEPSKNDWGPKPFKFFNCWISHPGFSRFIKYKWKCHDIQGWGAYILKEKLKHMKADLKKWSNKTFGLIDLKVEENKAEILSLDLIDDTFGLEDEEIIKRNMISAELLRDLHWKDNMLSQKAKAKWISEEDTNS
ncbi:hypothetical protein ACS0TY_034671 [Phlomoides rotata]